MLNDSKKMLAISSKERTRAESILPPVPAHNGYLLSLHRLMLPGALPVTAAWALSAR